MLSICKIWWNLIAYDTQEVKPDDLIVPSGFTSMKYICSVIEKCIILLIYGKIIMIHGHTFEADQYSPLMCTLFNFYCCFSKGLFFAFILWDYCWVKNTDLGSQTCGNKIRTLDKNNVFVYDNDGRRFIMFLTIHFLVFMALDFVNYVIGIFRVIT